jgi:hypothetical protein
MEKSEDHASFLLLFDEHAPSLLSSFASPLFDVVDDVDVEAAGVSLFVVVRFCVRVVLYPPHSRL